ncbi:MAG: ATP-binding cassette domain-containing protein [Syntrophales bacterium]|jgi:oligopeptide/dipeptide ABC transporter ATP-binding protein|nr:ATP-binding cassette domain-containing protein [Syntrophales bacterium]MDY0045289.1 ATP-binding cassette domain-containing protein [Syntrophales bacterium]
MSEPLLEVRNLTKYFPVVKNRLFFSNRTAEVRAVDDISFTIHKGETFGLVGESGCGKTTTSRLILFLEKITGGTLLFEGKDISKMNPAEFDRYRASVQAVFQDPYSSLSPRMKVGNIIAEPIIVNNSAPRKEVSEKISALLALVGLRKDAHELYPHEFSGGQRQRIAIARALAPNPQLIVLDEPVSALDVSIRAQIMNLLHDIQKKMHTTFLLIAHDLAVVKHMSNRIGVMYLGKLVEIGESEELYSNPVHPYTQALLSAALPSHPDIPRKMIILPGEVPSPLNPPAGCRFHPRCFKAEGICSRQTPSLKEVSSGHLVACHFA